MILLNLLIIHRDKSCGEEIAELCGHNPYVKVCAVVDCAEKAIGCLKKYNVDVVLLDAELPVVQIRTFIEKLRKINPKVIIGLMRNRESEAEGLCDIHSETPKSLQDIHEWIFKACLIWEKKYKAVVSVRTFGSFSAMHNGQPLHFANSKSKELLALCIDRMGAEMTMEEVIDVLWPERPYDENVKRLYRKAVMNLKDCLNEVVDEDIFRTSRGCCWLDIERISCDYFLFMNAFAKGTVNASVMDYYLPEYGWSEFTIAKIFFAAIERKEKETEDLEE